MVDDDSTDSYINRRILELTRFAKSIVVKNSCSEAFKYLEDCKIGAKVPDVVFLDYFMPIAGGREFLEEFKSRHPNISEKSKVVMLSVLDIDLNPMAYEKEMVFDRISKPLTQDKLEEVFNRPVSEEKNS